MSTVYLIPFLLGGVGAPPCIDNLPHHGCRAPTVVSSTVTAVQLPAPLKAPAPPPPVVTPPPAVTPPPPPPSHDHDHDCGGRHGGRH